MFLCERVENVHDNINSDSKEEKQPNIHKVRLFSIEVLINEEFNWNTQRPVDDIHYSLIQEDEGEKLPALPET